MADSGQARMTKKNMLRVFKTEGIVIKRKNYNEADRMLTVFTKHHGRMQIKAAGVRKITSRRSPHIELLNHCALGLYKGSHIPVLTEAQMLNDYSEIKSDLTKVGFAYHICELIDGLCPEGQENPAVFGLLLHTLNELTTDENSLEVIHGFEIQLLTLLGFWHKTIEDSRNDDTTNYIESILERKLKSQKFFAKVE